MSTPHFLDFQPFFEEFPMFPMYIGTLGLIGIQVGVDLGLA